MIRQIFETIGKNIKAFLEIFYIPKMSKWLSNETYLYAATGGANTGLDIFLFYVSYNFLFHKQIVDLGFIVISPHIAAFLFVFPITFITGFFLAKYVTFTASELKGKKQLIRYAISVGGSIVLNYILLKILVEQLEIFATPSKMITTVVVVIYSFIVQKFFTFKTGKKQLKAN